MTARTASPLSTARAAIAAGYCAAPALIALLFDNPLVIGAVGAATLAAGAAAGAGRAVRRALWLALPLALLAALINGLVARDGLTVLVRLGGLPPFGQLDVTLEAVVYGIVFGAKVAVVMVAVALADAAIDADDLLRAFRRVSFRSAVGVAVAARMIDVLRADAQRFNEARRCLPQPPPGRLTIMRAVAGGALDRAVDVAAALEVRGFGAHRRRPQRGRRPLSRHDLAVGASAATMLALGLAAKLGGVAGFRSYPLLGVDAGVETVALAAALIALALAPFVQRRGL